MSHQDACAETTRTNSAYLREALQWMLKGIRFDITFRTECRWTPLWLVQAALFWAWSIERTLTERFHCSQRLVQHLQGEQQQVRCSWQAFIELLSRHSSKLVNVLKQAFQQRMQQEFTQSWRTFGYAVLGVDGSTIEVPLTRSHRDAFATSKSKAKSRQRTAIGNPGADKRSATPLITLTTLFHVALNLPWDWRTGSREQSEREQLRQMLAGLPLKALLCADAGFVGYDLLRSITESGAQFIIRVGSNVQLLKQLGHVVQRDGLVFLWPEKIARRNQPPMILRLVVVQTRRGKPVYLVTSVLDSKRLKDSQVGTIYWSRWKIEVFYRHLKQTFGRRKLLSRKSSHATVELDWSLLGMWGMLMYASAELLAQGIELSCISMAKVLHAFRSMARDYLHPANRTQTLKILLRTAILDPYQRKNKNSPDYPQKKKPKSAGAPTIRAATARERRKLKSLDLATTATKNP